MFHVDAEVFTNGEFQKLHEKKKNLKIFSHECFQNINTKIMEYPAHSHIYKKMTLLKNI